SDADAKARHVEMADQAERVGPPPAPRSYLDVAAIIDAARLSGADAVHPGYGFLSESPAFVEACVDAGLVFVGPTADAMRRLGLKDEAKRIAVDAGVPIVPGYFDADADHARLRSEADAIGYPLLVKAIAGGGGRGMRVVEQCDALDVAIESAAREAAAAFGDDRLMLEKLIAAPRHIEVQIFGDTHGEVVHLFERDCTLQRRHQKVIEEAPAPEMSPKLRARMTQAAVTLASATGYAGAGTVEFLVEGGRLSADAPFYFIEMNTRLQVEHPVTEAITGLDLVEWQLRIASGEHLPSPQEDITCEGHAVELRLYAEDPAADFAPSVGEISAFQMPELGDLRVDTGVRGGDHVSPYYDAMIAKLIAHAPERSNAMQVLDAACTDMRIFGVTTNAAFLQALITHEKVLAGTIDTGFIAREIETLAPVSSEPPPGVVLAGLLAMAAKETASPFPIWNTNDAFQLGPPRIQKFELLVDETARAIAIRWQGATVMAANVDDAGEIFGTWQSAGAGAATFAPARDVAFVWHQSRGIRIERNAGLGGVAAHVASDTRLVAPISGRVASISLEEGAAVAVGDVIAVVEAMKMEHVLKATVTGKLARLAVAPDAQVAKGALIAEIDPEGASA
ncbi:MAG: biotin carboxylase N-terminal domain-containing protein, partial [Pseudomonadota bacterium]